MLQIEDLAFDSSARQLWVSGTEVHLSNKAFDLLALLIARRPDAVSKADLHAHLWPGTFVSPSSLPSLISDIRDALHDHRRDPSLVRTVHGFGYAFRAPQDAIVEDAADACGWLVGVPGELSLFTGENVLGREGPGATVLKSSTVSRRHARIALDAQGGVVEDLGSKNGTWVNDRRIESPTAIADGDQVRIGALLFTFRKSRSANSTQSLTTDNVGRGRS